METTNTTAANHDEAATRSDETSVLPGVAAGDLDACLRVLQTVADDPTLIDDHERFKALVAKIHRQGRKGDRRESGARKRAEDIGRRAATAMVRARREGVPLELASSAAAGVGEAPVRLHRPASCYVCKRPYTHLDPLYHLLCPQCAAGNRAKRDQRADLSGRIALLTGGRIKIGYQIALRLLRDGAERVIVTTRFPADAAHRFAAEPDHSTWSGHLDLVGLDLRSLPAVESFATGLLLDLPHLDILINNAAQTVKRPLAFYAHLLEAEGSSPPLLEAHTRYPSPATLLSPAEAMAPYFPPGQFDADGQQVDRRPENSWSAKLGEVDTLEALEVQLVNAVSPFLLCNRLRPLLCRSPFPRRFVVNVSAMEGQFGRTSKTARHPHTNMAKAGLNMLTRTSAQDLREDGIYLTSVDTGWVTDENPFPKAARMREDQHFFTPLDSIDGAARVYDPVARGINEPDVEPFWGVFLKDYAPHPW